MTRPESKFDLTRTCVGFANDSSTTALIYSFDSGGRQQTRERWGETCSTSETGLESTAYVQSEVHGLLDHGPDLENIYLQ